MNLWRMTIASSRESIAGGGFIGDIFILFVPEADRLLETDLRSSFTGASSGLRCREGGKFIPSSVGPGWHESVDSCLGTTS